MAPGPSSCFDCAERIQETTWAEQVFLFKIRVVGAEDTFPSGTAISGQTLSCTAPAAPQKPLFFKACYIHMPHVPEKPGETK